MMNPIIPVQHKEITTSKKTFFKLIEGSNYKVTQINRKVHVVEFEQFKKIASVINNTDVTFISINNCLVNKNRIEDIEPTTDKTESQVEAYAKKQLEISTLKSDLDKIETELTIYKRNISYSDLKERQKATVKYWAENPKIKARADFIISRLKELGENV